MYKDKYTTIELLILVFILLNSQVSAIILNMFKNYSIFEILVSLFLSFILGIFYISIIYKNYNDDLINYLKEKGLLKKIVSLLLIICSITIGIYTVINLSQIIKDILLPNQNSKIIILILLLVSFFLASKGLKSITVSANLLFIIYVFVIIISFFFNILNIDPINLLPIKLDINKLNFFNIFLYTISPILLIITIPKNKVIDFNNYKRKVKSTYIIFYIYLVIKILFIISILGIKYMSIIKYPEITLFKSINIFNFFERLEEILIINIFIENFILLAVVFNYTISVLSAIINFKYSNYFIFLIILIISISINNLNNSILLGFNLLFIILNLFLYKRKYRH